MARFVNMTAAICSLALIAGCSLLRPEPEVVVVTEPPCDLPEPPEDVEFTVYAAPPCAAPDIARCFDAEGYLRLVRLLEGWQEYRADSERACGRIGDEDDE